MSDLEVSMQNSFTVDEEQRDDIENNNNDEFSDEDTTFFTKNDDIYEVLEDELKRNLRSEKRARQESDVIDSMGDRELTLGDGCESKQSKSTKHKEVSPDQGCITTPESVNIFMPEWLIKKPDVLDATPNNNLDEDKAASGSNSVPKMPTSKDAHCYNMNHKNRGKCVIFNHEIFDIDMDSRKGSNFDAMRLEKTFKNLGFIVEMLDNLNYNEIIEKIEKLQKEDHSDNDCICIFVLTHGLANDFICAKDVAYCSDNIWKPFTADKCVSLAGKPKLFFFQACRGEKFDPGISFTTSADRTETDSSTVGYKIPTHADFLIAHCTVQGFYSWRNPWEGTWYIQCLCETIEEYAETTDLIKILTITSRKVATEYQSQGHSNPIRNEQKQVPSITSMLIRDLFFAKKS